MQKVRKKTQSLPSYHEEISRIKSNLRQSGSLALLFIDVSWMGRIEQTYGKSVYGEVLEVMTGLLKGLKGKEIRSDDLITIHGAQGEQFLVFLSRKRKDRGYYSTDLEGLAVRVRDSLNQDLWKTVMPFLKRRPRISVGHAILIYNPLIQEERQIYRLLEDGKRMAQYQQFRSSMRNKEKIQELIIKDAITTHFQPIVCLHDYNLLGYEGLSRGPKGTEYEAPSLLFELADEADLIFEVDRLCRRKAFDTAKSVGLTHHLFINCLPAAIHDPEFKGKPLELLLGHLGISPSKIVMEISEREAIRNYDVFRNASEYYKGLGFSIAVDDIGAGYSSLETVIELRPEFLKVDISLIHGIASDSIKQEIVRGIVAMAHSMKSRVIAEGIETEEELDTLLNLKVPFGQGFYINPPVPELARPRRMELS